MDLWRKLWRNLGPVLTVVALIAAVSFLPPDTSLQELRESGVLRACVPESYPPLVTSDDPAMPGIDVEILQAIAARLKVTLELNHLATMGRDFNPRNWRLTRGNCLVIAGGVVDSALTRSFLETSAPYAETGWAQIGPAPLPASLQGRKVGVVVAASGLDRLALSAYLRDVGAQTRIYRSPRDLEVGLTLGEVELGVTEALMARRIAADSGLQSAILGDGLPRYSLAFGLWKGDLTLKRAVDAAFAELQASGEIDAILNRYLGADRPAG